MEKQPHPDAINSPLPIQLGIRLALDSISYSNALPDWLETPHIDYSARESAIMRRIKTYLTQGKPEPPFEIGLPRKSGETKLWSMPSVNDQIVLQTCVSSIAQSLFERCVVRERVFSYRYRSDSATLALTDDHISSWRAFQRETRRRCSSADCVLQIDLENAFGSIDRVRFISFLRDLFPSRIEIDLLETLLTSLSGAQTGLPLVNDSIFFLGNAYLSVVDKVVGQHTTNFVRFVDDYRIFGGSQIELQNLAAALDDELRSLGFKINPHKLRLGTGESYLDSLSRIKYADTESDGAKKDDVEAMMDPDEYPGSATTFAGLIPADTMVEQIRATLDRPEENLNEGRGRFLIGSLRRARLDAHVVEGHSDGDNGKPALRRHFMGQISKDRPLVEKINHLLMTYLKRPDQMWRLTWLLYLAKDIDFDIVDRPLSITLKNTLSRIGTSHAAPIVARLWATSVLNPVVRVSGGQIEKYHEQGYLQSGQLLLGGSKHG